MKDSFGFLCRESGEPGVAGAWCLRWLVLVFDPDFGPGRGRGWVFPIFGLVYSEAPVSVVVVC